jgi:hypothetical protein
MSPISNVARLERARLQRRRKYQNINVALATEGMSPGQIGPFSAPLLAMPRLQILLGLLHLVKAEEPGIAVFASERIQKDKPQQRLQGNPVRTPYSIIALTLWAIRHHV